MPIASSRKIVQLLALVALVATGANSPQALAAKELRFAEFGPNRGDRAKSLKQFAADVEKRSGGELKIKIFWGSSLVKIKAVPSSVRDGVADMGTIIGFLAAKELPLYNMFDLPTGNADVWVGLRAVHKVMTENNTMKKEFSKRGLRYISNYSTGPIDVACRSKVTSLADLKGKKLRGSGPYGRVLARLGVNIQRMPFPKVYQALSSGVLDCTQNYISAILAYKHYEVTSHVLKLDWGQNMAFGIVINNRVFDALTPKQKSALTAAGAAQIDGLARIMMTSRAGAQKKLAAGIDGRSMDFVSPPAKEAGTLRSMSEQEVAKWVSSQGPDAKKVMSDYIAAVKLYADKVKTAGYPWKQ